MLALEHGSFKIIDNNSYSGARPHLTIVCTEENIKGFLIMHEAKVYGIICFGMD